MKIARIAFALIFASGLISSLPSAQAETVKVEMTAKEINGKKVWEPSVISAKKGDTVQIHAVSKIGGKNNIHGFAIPKFKVEELVDGKGKTFQFVANEVGTFPFHCQLHPAHVGGKVVISE